MMAYTVLARRYRATCFDQVIGQVPIAKTLQNAIAGGRVAHAYLFNGTRGVGKTSMARIMACALNAPDTVSDCDRPDDYAYPEADVQQRMAEAIMRGDDLNVIEIDGASNNSVDQARQLITNAGLSPTDQARYKVYIIDEVHMLSTQAFNALLKTMEEPPSHVKFILCTTEAHKVPATIQSRCQRFDFRNIATASIADHLRQVLGLERIDAEDDVVWQLARLGNGSMRDALSLLDRLIASGEQPLSAVLLESMLGLPPQQQVVQLVEAMADGDVGQCLGQVAALSQRGMDQDQIVDVLIDRLRQLMLVNACGAESDLVELSDDARTDAARQAQRFDVAGLVHMIALCDNLQRQSKVSSNPRALFDATVVRLALAEKMADVTALLAGVPTETKKKEPSAPLTSLPAPEGRSSEDETAGIWTKLLVLAAERPSLSWVANLQLDRIDDRAAYLAPKPGHRDLLSFAHQQRHRLAELFRDVVGHPVEVHLAESPRPDGAAPAPGPGQSSQEAAMAIPLVRQVLETFDATLVDTRPPNEPREQ